MGDNLLQAALTYAALNIYVFPIAPGRKDPAHKGWQQESTTDPAVIRSWWDKNPKYNVGINCEKSGLLVLDFDEKHGKHGLKELEKWTQAHGAMPTTWTVETPTGGAHSFYRTAEAIKSTQDIYPGVDIRSRGAYVVAAPSSTADGVYTWERDPRVYPLAAASESVTAFIYFSPKLTKQQEKPPFKVAETIPEGSRTAALVQLAGLLVAKGLSPDAAKVAIEAENAAKCDPPLTDDELEREVFPALTRPEWQTSIFPYGRDIPINQSILDKIRALDPATNKRYELSDIGNARLFVDICGDNVGFVEDRRRWVAYDGQRWNCDSDARVKEMLKQTADALYMYCLTIQDEDTKKRHQSHYGKWQSLRTRETILKDSTSVKPLKNADFDADPYLFNCKNGTLNLKTLEMQPHDPQNMISKIAGVEYVPGARCERWERFIKEISGGDAELARYIQKCMGYSLTGVNNEEIFFILYGPTSRNGKSSLLESISKIMGDYGMTARPETLAKKKYLNASAPSEDVARLCGARLVAVNEPERGLELDAAFIKTITGGDSVTARRLNEGSFEFRPAFKIFLNTNHRPRVNDLSVFMSDRIKLIPFNVHFSEERRDPHLKELFTVPENMSGIFNWCLEGLRLVNLEGIKPPAAVVTATKEYQQSEDKFGQFLEEFTEKGPENAVLVSELQGAFSSWCRESGLMPVGIKKIYELLEERQITVGRKRLNGSNNALKVAFGLKLRAIS